jgi:hypothetical protein
VRRNSVSCVKHCSRARYKITAHRVTVPADTIGPSANARVKMG